jgi:hypothetical protein
MVGIPWGDHWSARPSMREGDKSGMRELSARALGRQEHGCESDAWGAERGAGWQRRHGPHTSVISIVILYWKTVGMQNTTDSSADTPWLAYLFSPAIQLQGTRYWHSCTQYAGSLVQYCDLGMINQEFYVLSVQTLRTISEICTWPWVLTGRES